MSEYEIETEDLDQLPNLLFKTVFDDQNLQILQFYSNRVQFYQDH